MNLANQKILQGIMIGFEYEFYSNKTRKEIGKELGSILKKKILVGDVYHSETPVGPNTWKIEPDFSGGVRMNELITEPMPYHEAIATMTKVLTWIRSNGWTDEKCAMHINMSFDEFKIDLKNKMQFVNKLKFILGFDEEFIYQRFPKRKNSIYARSINQVIPINKFVFTENITHIHKENYELPSDKYYGINFSKLSKGYFEVRYCGGRGYEKKTLDLIEIIDYIGVFTYNVLQNNYSYTDIELSRLKNVIKEHKKVVKSFSDMESFFYNYPNIKLFVDLKGEPQILKTYWNNLRERLFDLIINCGVRKGLINYDSDVGKYQIKDAIIQKAFPIEGMEIFDSKIQGNIISCDLYRCVINNAHIIDSNLYSGNIVQKAKIINTPIHSYNEAHNCYIDNKKKIINGKVEGGIIRSGEIGPLAKVSKETEIIERQLNGGKGGDKDDKGAPSTIGKTIIGKV